MKMKIELHDENWTPEYVNSRPNDIFVYSDNNLRVGKIGQSVIRDLPNAMGIRTKKGPSNKPISYYSDSEYDQNIKNIRQDILKIKKQMISGRKIVLSKIGYGNGNDHLGKLAPKTFLKLCHLLSGHFRFDNLSGSISKRIPGYNEITTGEYVSLDNKKFESNVLSPLNNSYFKSEYLKNELYTLSDLISSGKKVAFTYPISHNLGDIIIFCVVDSIKYLVCRIVDSYDISEVDKETWSMFEGFEISYYKNLKFSNGKKLYQNHFEFICFLDGSGKMEFNSEFFENDKDDRPPIEEDFKIVGDTISVVDDKNNVDEVQYPQELIKILKKRRIEGQITKYTDDEINLRFYKKVKYQVKSDEIYYLIEWTKYPFWSSINIILTSKNSFI